MRVVHKKIERDQIMDRYWYLANLGAEETKGSILGQLKALDTLLELTQKPAEAAKSAARPMPVPDIYRSDWMQQ